MMHSIPSTIIKYIEQRRIDDVQSELLARKEAQMTELLEENKRLKEEQYVLLNNTNNNKQKIHLFTQIKIENDQLKQELSEAKMKVC